MPITANTSPGHIFPAGQPFDTDDLNAAANPSVTIDIGSGITGGDMAANTLTMANLQQGAYFFGEGTLAAGVYTVTLSPVAAAITRGQMVIFRADAANAGAVDIKLGSLAAVNLLDQNGQELVAGDIVTGDIMLCIAMSATTGPFRIIGRLNTKQHRYATSAGNAVAQTLDYGLDVPSLAAIEGFPLVFKVGPGLSSAGATTLAIDGLAATAIKNPSGGDLVTNDLVAGTIAVVVYNGTNFSLLNPAGFSPYSISGLVYQKIVTVDAAGMDQPAGVQIPYDNTIPGSAEGQAYGALNTSITPKSAASSLFITITINGIQTDTDGHFTVALFMDAEGSARAASTLYIDAPSPADSNTYGPIVVTYKMASGTTASRTFKVRCGHSGATTDWGIGGQITGGTNDLGGTIYNSLTVEEIG